MRIWKYIACFAVLGLASCSELITSEPPPEQPAHSEYGWSVGSTMVLTSPDGFSRTLTVSESDDTTRIVDKSGSGSDTLRLEKHGDSVMIRGISSRTFFPLPFGARLESDSDVTNRTYPAQALVGDPDSLFFVSGASILVYDPKRDAVALLSTLPSGISLIERSSNALWYAITSDDHLWQTSDRGRNWSDQGPIPGHATAADAAPFKTLFVATEAGDILRYDGNAWTTAFTLAPVRHVNCLKFYATGPSYTLYAGTQDGYVVTLQSSGTQRADAMTLPGSTIPITGIALDVMGGHDRVWAAGRGAIFVGRNFGQSWKPIPGAEVDARSIFNIGDQIWVGTNDGRLVHLHEDDAPQFDQVSAEPILDVASSFGEMQVISGSTILSAKQRPWRVLNTSVRSALARPRAWVFLTQDSVWKAAEIVLNGQHYTYTGRILDHAREIKLHGKEHRDILVVRYAVESGSPDIKVDSTNIPMYVVYFEVKHGPIRIEVIQEGRPTIIEEVE